MRKIDIKKQRELFGMLLRKLGEDPKFVKRLTLDWTPSSCLTYTVEKTATFDDSPLADVKELIEEAKGWSHAKTPPGCAPGKSRSPSTATSSSGTTPRTG